MNIANSYDSVNWMSDEVRACVFNSGLLIYHLCDLGQVISLKFKFPHLEKEGNSVFVSEFLN